MQTQQKMYRLWYQSPTDDWQDGLPIGNGRLAAMAVQEAGCDRFVLNHEKLWRGLTRERTTKDVSRWLPEVRKLIDEGDFFRATALANLFFANGGGISGTPALVDAYQPAGELCLEMEPSYQFTERSLCLNTGVAETVRTKGADRVTVRGAVDCTDGKMLVEVAGTAAFSASIYLTRIEDPAATVMVGAVTGKLFLEGSFHGGISFAVEASIQTDGQQTVDGNKLSIAGASYLHVILDIGTEGKKPDTHCDFAACFAAHTATFSGYMGRFGFALDSTEDNRPTDQRIAAMKEGADDPSINELYVHYGRYLLLSSSVCGKYPANLQGKWNNLLNPPWDSDYHFDINLEMNYWLAEPCGMPECVEALVSLIEDFYESGEKAAKDLYGCRGIWLPIQTDVWGRATPESFGWAVWIGAAGWIGWHFWQHYRYSGDLTFLKEHAYPYFKRVALLYEDYLQEDAQGILQIYPSQSPENRFTGTGNFPVSIGKSSGMDVQLAFDSFGYAIQAATLLGDAENAARWTEFQKKLPGFPIGKDGRLLEWEIEREEVEPGHRHLSHLYGLYPSDLFTKPEYAPQKEAAIRSLHARLAQGGGHTGWSRAWVACLMARIGEGESFYEHFNALIRSFATSSLLDLHPPHIFQIDGNLGAVAAAVEAVVSVQADGIRLLNGLPKNWSSGSMSGVRLPGGHQLSLSWKNGKLTALTVTFGFEQEFVITGIGTLTGTPGETREISLI